MQHHMDHCPQGLAKMASNGLEIYINTLPQAISIHKVAQTAAIGQKAHLVEVGKEDPS